MTFESIFSFMISKCDRNIIVLTESEKFNSHGVVPLQLKERIDTIITDDHIPEDIKTHLLSENKTLLTIENK